MCWLNICVICMSLICNYNITIDKMAQRVGILCDATIKIDFVSDFLDT